MAMPPVEVSGPGSGPTSGFSLPASLKGTPRDLLPITPPDRHAVLSSIFDAMDGDKSGQVDADEFKSIFSEAGEKYAADRLKEIDGMRDHGNSDGSLDRSEFVEFMLEYLAEMGDRRFLDLMGVWQERIAATGRKLVLRRVFTKMDVDASGAVSLTEFSALAGDEVDPAETESFFRWIDDAAGNDDGLLEQDEWVRFVLEMEEETPDEAFGARIEDWLSILEKKRRSTLLRQLYRKMDADASGEVDLDEFKMLVSRDAEANDGNEEEYAMIFHHLDGLGNSDGMLSETEWVDGMKHFTKDYTVDQFEAEAAKWHAVLTRNQRTVWRAVYRNKHAKSLVTAARAVGATHLIFVRHAHCEAFAAPPPALGGLATAAHDWRKADAARPLTNRGEAQCMVARDEWFGKLPIRRVLLASPARRAMETAQCMAGGKRLADAGWPISAEGGDGSPIVSVDPLQPAGQSELCEELFAQLGNAPLRGFLRGTRPSFGLRLERLLRHVLLCGL